MFGLGFGELLIVLVIILVVFSRRLPELGATLGASIRKFKKAANEADEIDVTPKSESDRER